LSRIKTAKKSKSRQPEEKADLREYDPLVFAIARKYSSFFPYIDIEEFISEGKLGLLEASVKYKKNKKTAFSTYAWFWIVKNIQNYISKNVNIIETPQNVRNTLSAIKKIVDVEAKAGKKVSLAQLSKILDVDVSELSDTLAISGNISNVVYLDKEIDTGEQSRSFSESVEDRSQPGIFDSIVQSADNEMLSEMLDKLSDKENAVLSFRFALAGCTDKKMSIKDIAKKLHITSAKVKDLESSALIKLKGMIKEINE
jgi:RNA polymerase sigma factor, sigma-70 family